MQLRSAEILHFAWYACWGGLFWAKCQTVILSNFVAKVNNENTLEKFSPFVENCVTL